MACREAGLYEDMMLKTPWRKRAIVDGRFVFTKSGGLGVDQPCRGGK